MWSAGVKLGARMGPCHLQPFSDTNPQCDLFRLRHQHHGPTRPDDRRRNDRCPGAVPCLHRAVVVTRRHPIDRHWNESRILSPVLARFRHLGADADLRARVRSRRRQHITPDVTVVACIVPFPTVLQLVDAVTGARDGTISPPFLAYQVSGSDWSTAGIAFAFNGTWLSGFLLQGIVVMDPSGGNAQLLLTQPLLSTVLRVVKQARWS